jgi:COP9 signalosome complex subunit 3
VINPALNSVPYVFVLLANITAFQNQSSNALDGAILWDKIVTFLENFDPIQIRYVGLEFRQVVIAAANLARRSQQVCIPIRLPAAGSSAYPLFTYNYAGSSE